MLGIRTWLRVVIAACLGFALVASGRAWAANFEVSPIRVSLSEAASSALLTVRNQSSEPLRFQVNAFAWTQGPGGEMELSPTTDLVIFPTMFSLRAGETRNLRIGSTAPLGSAEKTYRVFVEELPPLNAPGASPNAIRVLTRMGIPVFRGPSGGAPRPEVGGLGVQGNHVAFSLQNKGSSYFLTRRVRLSGVAADGRTIFTRELPAWYVLAGGARAYTLDLPDDSCGAVRLLVDVETIGASVQASAALPPRTCAH